MYSEINLRWPVDNCQPVGISKKWNAFSAWLCRMGSHHDRQSFCLPGHPIPMTLGIHVASSVMYSFSFCGHVQHVWLIYNRAVLSVKQSMMDHVEQPELACQRHKIIVKHMFDPCQIFWWPCMYLNLWPLTGLTEEVCCKSSSSIWPSLEIVHVPNYVQKTFWSNCNAN